MSYAVEELTLQPTHALAIRELVPMSELPAFFSSALPELMDQLAKGKGSFAGPPLARYFSFQPEHVDVEVALPTTAAVRGSGRVKAVDLPGGHAVQVRHVGPYGEVKPAYEAISSWLESHHMRATDAPREVYLSDPGSVPAAELQTVVVQPIE